ncbi:MAG: hypothetical protein M3203_14440 [Actinomycetota bacterium]|nr:hypothetical protein [Actinomycetota bacterium]
MGNDYADDGDRPGPSRREVIRRGALLLGVGAWAAPLVQVVRQHRHGGAGDPAPEPEVIGVQQVTEPCTTCPEACPPILCGQSGVLACLCAPPADAYPPGDCICVEEVFCLEATPCREGCPDGWGCIQGCCDEPVCAPPCPVVAPIVAPEGLQVQASPTSELTGRGLTLLGREF